MGLYDYLRCAMPLPAEGANEHTYQTKDTPYLGHKLNCECDRDDDRDDPACDCGLREATEIG